MTEMLTLTIDGTDVQVPKGSTVMAACKAAGKEIPHFCYHERLSVAGNCRMCLVEVEKAPKPVASCHWPAADGMVVHTQSPKTIEARKGTMEFLLINHPLDCPICDQGGECDLQDQAVAYGSDRARFQEFKRAVDDKDIGAKIKTVMTRCIHCTRCIRFATEIAGVEEFGATGRGENMQVGTYVEAALQSELAGNMIDLCPVGALTSKPYAYTARPWELAFTDAIDVMDAVGSHIRVDTRAGEVMRVLPRECAELNEEWLTDMARFSYDALKTNRLTTPLLNVKGKFKEVGWPDAFAKLVPVLQAANPDVTVGLAGDLHCAEDLLSFKLFMRDVLCTDHLDARGDGCHVAGGQRGNYLLHLPLQRVEETDCAVLIGCNPRYEAPMLNLRLRKAVRNGGAQVFVIGPALDLTYPYTSKWDNPQDLEALLDGKSVVAKAMQRAKKPLVLVGAGVLTRPDAQAILFHAALLAEQNNAMQPDWQGFGVVQHKVGRVAALDVQAHPTAGGWPTARILHELHKGNVELLLQYGDIEQPTTALRGAKYTVYIGTHLTEQAQQADFVLPAAAFTEKPGVWVNLCGQAQTSAAATKPPHNAKEDWKIFRALSGELGRPLPFETREHLRALLVQQCPYYDGVGVAHSPASSFTHLSTNPLPLGWDLLQHPIGKSGPLSATPLVYPLTQNTLYISNELLRQSPTMHTMQAESNAQTAQAKVAA